MDLAATQSDHYFDKLFFRSAIGILSFVLAVVAAVFGILGTAFWVISQVGNFPAGLGRTFLMIGALLFALILPLLIKSWRQVQETAVLFQTGLRTFGEIIELKQNHSVRVNYQHPWILSYRYQVNGILFEGSQNVWNLPAGGEEETRVVVYYNPAQPNISRIQ